MYLPSSPLLSTSPLPLSLSPSSPTSPRAYVLTTPRSFVSQAQGENNYFSKEQIPRAVEACKSNALMRCCKDLGVAAELWDKRFVRTYKDAYAQEVWVEHVVPKKKVKIWLKRDDRIEYPFKLSGTRPV